MEKKEDKMGGGAKAQDGGGAAGGRAAAGVDSEDGAVALVRQLGNLTLGATHLDLSGIYKSDTDPSIFTENLTYINLSHNELKEVPKAVIALKNIVKLDLSNNLIKHFNDTPAFLKSVQELSLANNELMAPPLWVWKDAPPNLQSLNLSNNVNMVSSLKTLGRNEYFHCWLSIKKITMFNCRLHTCTDVLYTLTGVRELILGGGSITASKWNELYEFPMECLTCTEARIINLNNCKIYDINKSITNYSAVTHLDIGVNYIVYLPEEIGDLIELEVLIMSSNKLEGLPASIFNLTKLRVLLISSNRFEHLPDNLINGLPELKCLDIFDNCFNALPEGYEKLDEFDFAQNYTVEPDDPEYILKRTELRKKYMTFERSNGIKIRPVPTHDHDDDDDDGDDSGDSDGSHDDNWEQLPMALVEEILPHREFVPEENWDINDPAQGVGPQGGDGYDAIH